MHDPIDDPSIPCWFNFQRFDDRMVARERGSVLLSSNLPFSQSTAIFKDPVTTAAAIDRLVHHSVIVEFNVPSLRLETAKTTQKTAATNADGTNAA